MRKINDAAAVVGATVVHANHNAPAVVLVSHAKPGAKRKRWMGSSKPGGNEALSVGSETACKAIIETIVAGSAARQFSLHCKGRQGAESNGSNGKETKHFVKRK